MSSAAPPAPTLVLSAMSRDMFHRYSVATYQHLTRLGVFTEDDNVELIDGYVLNKMAHNPPHDVAVQWLTKRLVRLARPGWEVRIQLAATLANSEPEPDAVFARGDENTFATRHPGRADIGLVFEVSATSLDFDRLDKGRIYAQAAIPTYWVINVIDRQVEVYTDPRPADPVPSYATQTDYKAGDSVPLLLDGQTVAQIPVNDLLS
jgi:Uma2 family endonuclease